MVNIVGLTEVQKELLAVLTNATSPITGVELRRRVNAKRTDPLITEQVYRRLVALERRGLIQRVPTPPGRRDTCWQPSEAARRKGYGL